MREGVHPSHFGLQARANAVFVGSTEMIEAQYVVVVPDCWDRAFSPKGRFQIVVLGMLTVGLRSRGMMTYLERQGARVLYTSTLGLYERHNDRRCDSLVYTISQPPRPRLDTAGGTVTESTCARYCRRRIRGTCFDWRRASVQNIGRPDEIHEMSGGVVRPMVDRRRTDEEEMGVEVNIKAKTRAQEGQSDGSGT